MHGQKVEESIVSVKFSMKSPGISSMDFLEVIFGIEERGLFIVSSNRPWTHQYLASGE